MEVDLSYIDDFLVNSLRAKSVVVQFRTDEQLAIVFYVHERLPVRTCFLVTQPRFEAIESQWLELGVKLVGEKLGSTDQGREVTDTEDALSTYNFSVTRRQKRIVRINPLHVDHQPRPSGRYIWMEKLFGKLVEININPSNSRPYSQSVINSQ